MRMVEVTLRRMLEHFLGFIQGPSIALRKLVNRISTKLIYEPFRSALEADKKIISESFLRYREENWRI